MNKQESHSRFELSGAVQSRLPIALAQSGAEFQVPADGFIHIMPFGAYQVTQTPKDGKPITFSLVIDAESIQSQITAFEAEKLAAGDAWAGKLVDFDHSSMDQSRSTEAAGWADALECRADGLWAKIRWSDAGLKAIKGGRYRYTSPVHLPRDLDKPIESGSEVRPLKLYNLALTNVPRMLRGDFPMQPISSRADETTKKETAMDYKAKLLSLLGLKDDATDADIEKAIESEMVEDEAVESMKKEVTALKTRVLELEAIFSSKRADEAIAGLEKDGFAIASRDDLRSALISDFDVTMKSVRLIKPVVVAAPVAFASNGGAPKADEPIRSRGEPPAEGAKSLKCQQDEAIECAKKKYGLKSRAQCVARAIDDNPELFKSAK